VGVGSVSNVGRQQLIRHRSADLGSVPQGTTARLRRWLVPWASRQASAAATSTRTCCALDTGTSSCWL